MDNTINHAALAREAIQIEGAATYFPGLDLDTFDATVALAEYLEANPNAWSPPGDDCAWSFDGDLDDLAEVARGHGATEVTQ